MTKQVNDNFARAAEGQQPALMDYLDQVFASVAAPGGRREYVDNVIEHMGRNLQPPRELSADELRRFGGALIVPRRGARRRR